MNGGLEIWDFGCENGSHFIFLLFFQDKYKTLEPNLRFNVLTLNVYTLINLKSF
ncbi:hypothetical protein HNP25_000901 [Arcicella rosea]|uniref:Uncharacterized protein n=1 Tax=Arcicella rosea TaxID=502909 RepID=A0A841ES32_9BACT|nr:hypothetical protein [Arcicella rosea]